MSTRSEYKWRKSARKRARRHNRIIWAITCVAMCLISLFATLGFTLGRSNDTAIVYMIAMLPPVGWMWLFCAANGAELDNVIR